MSESDSQLNLAARESAGVGTRVASSVALLWSTNMLMRGMQLATTAILARLLTPGDYGLIAIAATVAGFIDLMSNLQTGGALMRLKELTGEHLGSAFSVNMIRGLLTSLALVLLAQPLADYMGDARLAGVLYALAPSALMNSLHNPYFLLFARNIDYRREAKRNALAAIGGSMAGIAVALAVPSYWALVAGSLCTSAIALGLSYWRVPGMPRPTLKKSAEFLSYGSWLILINLMEYANSKVDYLLIGKGLGNRPLGAYHLGQQVTVMATGDIVAPMSQALMPAFSILSGDPERLRAAYRRLQSLTLALALPVGFGVSALAEPIVFLLVGRQWEQAIPVIHFLAPIIALQTVIASIESLALATHNGRLLVIRTFIYLCVRTGLMFAGFYMGGYPGIIYARMLSGSFFLIYGLTLAAHITGSRWFDPLAASWRSFASVAVMWCVLYALPAEDTLVALGSRILLGGALYIGTHLLLWKLSGLPEGAESKLLELARQAWKRVL